ncbi:MAG: hypothetical protein K9J21_07200 [Bacteroidales bacterium]|nr:hypothetical protein [Bacteroidales bacterium]
MNLHEKYKTEQRLDTDTGDRCYFCGEPAEYYYIFQNRTQDGLPFDTTQFYCEECLRQDYNNEYEDIWPMTFREWMAMENIKEV